MKGKKGFRRVLSALLSAVMLMTMTPSVTQAQQTEKMATQLQQEVETPQQLTEESQQQVNEIQKQTDKVQQNLQETIETGEQKTEEQKTVEETQPVADGVIDLSAGYYGPTIDYNPASPTAGAVTIYYYAQNFTSEVSQVYIKGAWDASWSDWVELSPVEGEGGRFSVVMPLEKMSRDKSFAYGYGINEGKEWDIDDCNPSVGGNSEIKRNPVIDESSNVTLYYYPSHGNYPESVKVKYRLSGTEAAYTESDMALDSVYTKIYSTTLSGLLDGDYEYVFEVDGNEIQDTNNVNTGKFSVSSYPAKDDSIVSPVINGKEVTFNYYGPTNTNVKLAGSMTSWADGAQDMIYNETTGYWSLTLPLAAGNYQYKLIVDSNWILDPLNQVESNGNSAFIVTGLENKECDAAKGKEVLLPETFAFYNADGTKTDKTVSYTLSEDTAKEDYSSKISLSEEGQPKLTIAADFPEAVTEFTLCASDEAGNTGLLTVHVVSKTYKYTIYYYNPEKNKDTAALWIWETAGAAATKSTSFSEEEELADGNTWMKAEIEVGYTNLSIIPKEYGETWGWQEDTRIYENTEAAEETTLYIVTEDATRIYTELPEIKKIDQRYLIVEYAREMETPEGWFFYTWNSGYGNNVYVHFEEIEGVWTAKVKMKQGLESISFCIGKGGEGGSDWTDQDGADYKCDFPADQTIVKIRMEEGKGITHKYPYNKGYEMSPVEDKIHFYYRDDNAFAAGNAGGFHSVKIEIDGEVHEMNYDEEAQRYCFDLEGLSEKEYKYRYILQKEEGSSQEYVTDKYNPNTISVEEKTYSVLKYEILEVIAEASVWNASMDYNDNNVLSVSLKGTDEEEFPKEYITSVEADLSALGGSAKTVIDTSLMELSFAVKEGTETGEKTIPVTVYDVYNNEHKTEAKVTVTQRNENEGFSWEEAIIYFAVTDRFYDGNTANNKEGYDVSETGSSSYHGGDFKGLTQKLDYLQELGVNTIWITPIVENAMEQGLQTDVAGITSWGYHGYWASNFEKLDSRMGTENEFKTLLNAAHSRGMKIMVDVVLNHSGYGMEEYFNNILKEEDGTPIPMIRDSSETVIGDDQKSSLSGLPDFLTENEEVRDLLVEWQSKWVSKFDIDYYRVDTVKHVDNTTWSAFKNALTKIDPDFKMIGEWAGAGYATDTGMLRTGRMDSLLDFDFNNVATDFVMGDVEATEKFMKARNTSIDNTATLGSFLGSHDEVGFVQNLLDKKIDEKKARASAKLAASLQMTAKGQIVIYYGEEIGMTGENNYPYQTNRYDFDWSLVNNNNDMLAHYKKLLAVRNAYSDVLAKGERTTIYAKNNEMDVFARSYGGTTIYTALNLSEEEKAYTFTGQTPGTFLLDLYNETEYYVGEEGKVTVKVPAAAAGGTAIFAESTQGDPFHVECAAEKTYTGKNIVLSQEELKVYYGLTLLEAGKDYKVSYKNNKATGTATVTVTAAGNYSGKDIVTFEILPRQMRDEEIEIQYQSELIANKKEQQPLAKISCNGIKLGNKDYKVEYFALNEEGQQTGEALKKVKAEGVYNMVITGLYDAEKKKGGFTGSTVKEVTVYPSGTYMKNTAITIGGSTKIYSTPYTGTEIRPEVKVTLKDSAKTPQLEGEHFKVSYKENKEIGTAQVILTGIPEKGLMGTITKTFKITGVKLSTVAQVNTANWKNTVPFDVKSGCGVQPVDEAGKNLVTLLGKGNNASTVFTEGTDYLVSYSKNDKAGQAVMIFTGIGKYTGTVTKKFNVGKITLSEADEKLSVTADTETIYSKKGSKINLLVSYDDVVLKEGKDYKVTYKNNKAVTTTATKKKPLADIIGIGSFAGKVTREFRINPSDIANMRITTADTAYQNKKGKFMSVPVILEADGTKLANNKDFTCTYFLLEGDEEIPLTKADVADAGATIKVVATAKGNAYTGSISCEYKITVQDIAKASVTIKAQVYTGKEITITEEDFTKIKVGDTTLKLGKHYEITGDYSDNINKGNAKVTIKGIGNYGGTKTVTFKIASRPMTWWWNFIH